ncbi:MAG: chlorophyll synthase ChlG [Oceanibaculum nanhaiense]|uniref:chlorophyll synthase ChlG n=1 Tax=Oceanibaculum nanhaiense TaxID=1909734 RepID=UPI0025A47F51|nr:chlorophyll synthase ChlG [Oceanibaculum nanhaiense]MDM7947301.1 chlorophyll synthase ChlG [Oceanibaculum nanhaiense]
MEFTQTQTETQARTVRWPSPGAVLALLKPITWFPPMWAYVCGAVAAGAPIGERWYLVALGILLAGPLICGTSQAVNDWFDRHVDAINEPDRVIPSGRMPGSWGLYISIVMTVISAAVALLLGPWVFTAALFGLAFAWAYSAPPFRFKQNGWIGNGLVGFSYETLPWLTAAVAVLGQPPSWTMAGIALLYGLGAHGILTLNDFKSIRGDREMGIRSLPARYGAGTAALITCVVIAVAQLGVIVLLHYAGLAGHAIAIEALLALQLFLMVWFLRDPVRRAVIYSAAGVGLYVTGMMVAAFGLRGLAAAL